MVRLAMRHASSGNRNNWLVVVVVGVAILGGVSLRFVEVASKRWMNHDEGISYLAASCHQGQYTRIFKAGTPPFGRWVPASKWKQLLKPEQKFCFDTIAKDLAEDDVHPPLYFWMLHTWMLVFGADLWTGPALNIVLAAVTALMLFVLARRALGSDMEAALVTWIWSFSPAAIAVVLQARQYSLLSLCVVVFVWSALRYMNDSGTTVRNTVMLTISTVAGMLTHYHFAIIVFGLSLWILATRIKTSTRRVLSAAVAVSAGLILFVTLHPRFFDSVVQEREQIQYQTFNSKALIDRGQRTVDQYASFLWPSDNFDHKIESPMIQSITIVVAVATLMWLTVLWNRRRSGDAATAHSQTLLFLFAWTAVTNIVLYLGFVSPFHAMKSRHLAAVWVFYAFVPIIALRMLSRGRHVVTVVLCITMMVSGSIGAFHVCAAEARYGDLRGLFEPKARIVSANVQRGIFPKFFANFPDGSPVYAANSNYLLENTDQWIDLLQQGDYVITQLAYGETQEKLDRLLSVISRSVSLVRVHRHWLIWRVRERIE